MFQNTISVNRKVDTESMTAAVCFMNGKKTINYDKNN